MDLELGVEAGVEAEAWMGFGFRRGKKEYGRDRWPRIVCWDSRDALLGYQHNSKMGPL